MRRSRAYQAVVQSATFSGRRPLGLTLVGLGVALPRWFGFTTWQGVLVLLVGVWLFAPDLDEALARVARAWRKGNGEEPPPPPTPTARADGP